MPEPSPTPSLIRTALEGPADPPPPDPSVESAYERIFRRNRE